MIKELSCPQCGSSNVVEYEGVHKCFDCGYEWSKTASKRKITSKERWSNIRVKTHLFLSLTLLEA